MPLPFLGAAKNTHKKIAGFLHLMQHLSRRILLCVRRDCVYYSKFYTEVQMLSQQDSNHCQTFLNPKRQLLRKFRNKEKPDREQVFSFSPQLLCYFFQRKNARNSLLFRCLWHFALLCPTEKPILHKSFHVGVYPFLLQFNQLCLRRLRIHNIPAKDPTSPIAGGSNFIISPV